MPIFQVKRPPIFYQKIGFNQIEIAYTEAGKGELTLLFIHGLGHSRQAWQKNLPELSQSYRCIAIDLPGFGLSSDHPEHTYGMGFYAQVIRAFLQSMGLKKVVLAGHSMGGQIALTYALQYPGELYRLLLFSPAGFEDFSPWDKTLVKQGLHLMDFFTDEKNSLREAVESSFYGHLPLSAESYLQELFEMIHLKKPERYKAILDQCIIGMLNEPVLPQLGTIKTPGKVYFGSNDALIPNRLFHPISTTKFAQKAVKNLPKAELEVIPFTGHFLHWERYSMVNGSVLNWLRQE